MPVRDDISTPGASAFDDASRLVLDHLQRFVPLEMWTVSRLVDGRQVYLEVTDNPLGLEVGGGPRWSDSLCAVMWDAGRADGGPVSTDVRRDSAYARQQVTADLGLTTYVGMPLMHPDGTLFGTVCGVDRRDREPPALGEHGPLLETFSELLTTVLRSDLHAMSLARQLEATRRDAGTDPLTGVRNRRAWDDLCRVEEERHHSVGDHASVVVVDLDDLKLVNDRDGHAAGDRLIASAAVALRAHVRDTDHVARIGGDEFAVLLPCTTADQAAAMVARVRAALQVDGVRASLGVATMRRTDSLAETLAAADRAMYDDKRRRRGR